MKQTTAQVVLALIFLGGAVLFVLLGEHELAVGLVGALAGQGASAGVRTAVNGKAKGEE